jgi:hypothetical protein
MAPPPALGSGEKVSALQDPEEATVRHALHCFTYAISEADRSVTGCLRAIYTRFQNRDDDSFFPHIPHYALRPYAVAFGQQKLLACEWKL